MTDRYNRELAELLPNLPSGYRWRYEFNSDKELGTLSIQIDAGHEGWWYGAEDSFRLSRSLLGSRNEESLLNTVAIKLYAQQFPPPPPQSKLIGVTRE